MWNLFVRLFTNKYFPCFVTRNMVLFLYENIIQYLSQNLAFCDLPKDEGTGSNVVVYLYYNKTADKCYPFRYQGQGGNKNRFIAEIYCMRNCSARAESVYPTNKTKACHLPKAAGDCYGNYLRYYYDSGHGKCKTFSWTGCVGNGNRFLDPQRCNTTCFGLKGKYKIC
ncbi:hypothetical protein P4O66_015754 [Electrophorus voltai]|uniref:BPTI/Kunitz inhibitor domain-containing protein n=1 Tax=Electrophorus voltai TaxID=2609070 RepID=A0AAD8YZK7_9TELE|nr:hypothetical protein P4O66_015754 [Electrophorus voltai]